jgi:uncharacterized protein YegP (UPF0339 family)
VKIHIRKNDSNQFSWAVHASNGNKIAWSGEPYTSKAGCEHALKLLVHDLSFADVIDETGEEPINKGRANLHFPQVLPK